MKKILCVLLIIFAMLIITGCDTATEEEPIQSAEVPDEPEQTINSFEECAEAGNPIMESYPRQCRADDQTFTEEIDEPIEVPAEECEQVCSKIGTRSEGWYDSCTGDLIEYANCAEPFCGDDRCNENEDCHDCHEDCGCSGDEQCFDSKCTPIFCGRDYECNDDNACTVDVCQFPEHPNAYCDHEEIEECDHGDDCCPAYCDAETDNDCDPVCGNDVCEEDENDTCEEDCE